jgi:hypothetical protein
MQDEKDILGHILEKSTEFKIFYDKERPKAGSITWIEESVMPAEDIIAYADVLKGEIHYKNHSSPTDNAHTFAHEIMHLVRGKENGILMIKSLPSFFVFAAKLSSMLEDPLVDSFLQKSYNFDLRVPYRHAIDYCRKNVKTETTDDLSRLLNGIDLANYMLRWSLINDKNASDDWAEYLIWYEKQRPYSYKIANQIVRVVWIHGGAHGADTIEKQEKVVAAMINLYPQLQGIISI